MKKKNKIIIISILGVILLLLLAFFTYFSFYYHADKSTYKYLESTKDVKVTYKNHVYFFDGKKSDKAIIIYPGAKVDAKSYARISYKLSEEGIDVFLIKMPFNFPLFGINKASKIIKNNNYKDYYIMGHSLGGVAANSFVNKNSDKVSGIIFLSSYPTKKISENINLISIYGTKDKVLNKDKYNESKKFFNSNYSEYIIDGANHANFGDYGDQKGDGKATIEKEEQQDIVIDLIINKFK